MDIDLEQRFRRIEQLWTSQNWAEWATTTAPGYTFAPGIGPDRDLSSALAWSRGMFGGFPDLSQTLEHVIPAGDVVVGVAVCRGTHCGTLDLGLGAQLPPTGRTLEFAYVKVLRFDDDGLVVHDRQYFDAARLLRQLHQGANSTGRWDFRPPPTWPEQPERLR